MEMTLDEVVPKSAAVDCLPAKPWLSLILATVGRSEELHIVLDSLADQEERGFEIIVVDQNPDDRLVPILNARRDLTIRHLRQDRPNLSAARNRGLVEAAGDWVAFPDDDCWYEPGSIAAVQRQIVSMPSLGGIVARWVEADPSGPRPAHDLDESAWRGFRGGDASSIALFLRRESVLAMSGFDARIGVGQYFGAGEETDLLLRLLSLKKPIRYLPDARVHHVYSKRAPAVTRRAWRATRARARGVGAIYAKHRLSPFVIARGLAAPLINPLLGPHKLAGLFHGSAAVLGRIQGMVRWRLRHKD